MEAEKWPLALAIWGSLGTLLRVISDRTGEVLEIMDLEQLFWGVTQYRGKEMQQYLEKDVGSRVGHFSSIGELKIC